MADDHQQKERKQHGPATPRLRRTSLIAVVLVTIIGAVVYAYDLGFRQGAKHAPPLITADPSPTKMPPASPGGIEIPHQDKLVYQRLSTAREPTKAQVEILLPPPEEPLPKPARDIAPQLASAAAATIVSDAGSTASTLAPVTQTSSAAKTAAPPSSTPPTPLAPVSSVQAVAKPAQQAVALAVPTPSSKRAAPVPALKAPPINATYLVQLGSFRTDAAAQVGWQRLAKRHRAILEQLPHRVAQADLGAAKGIYHRLQVGAFNSRGSADALCRQLKAQGQDCLIVKR